MSDHCELNRQIKADIPLLLELKTVAKKLMQTIKLPALAEAMELTGEYGYFPLYWFWKAQIIRKSECVEA